MSQTFLPYGLSFNSYKGGKNRMATSVYPLSSVSLAIAQGDAVIQTEAGVQEYNALPTVPASGAFPSPYTVPLGVFIDASWITATGQVMAHQPYWPGATAVLAGSVPVCTIADLTGNVYQIQCNTNLTGLGSVGLSTTTGICGYNFNIMPATPNPANGQSLQSLNMTYVAPGTTGGNYWMNARVVGLGTATQSGQTNSWADPYPDVLIVFNNHKYKAGTQGV